MYINGLSERTHKSLIIKKIKKYSLTCPNSIGLLMDSPKKKKNNGFSGMTRASFLQIVTPNTALLVQIQLFY